MTRYILSLFFILTLSTNSYSQKKVSSKLLACCAVGGRCTGSSYCTACSNCSGCKHCAENGGSCGVCAGGSGLTNFSSTSSTNRVRKKKKGSTYSTSSSVYYNNATPSIRVNEFALYDSILTVKTSILNVRTGPGKDYPIIVTLEKGDSVRVLETSAGDWIKVEIIGTELKVMCIETI